MAIERTYATSTAHGVTPDALDPLLKLYAEYIPAGSARELNLQSVTRNKVVNDFRAGTLTLQSFETVRKEVQDMMYLNSFPQLVRTLNLGDRLDHRPSELSGGQQQRVAIARALVTKPDVVFADEPTGNLDSRAGAQVLSFLRRSVRELEQTVIMVTHDPAAAAYADRVVLLADGRIAGDIVDPTPESVLAGLDALRQLEGV